MSGSIQALCKHIHTDTLTKGVGKGRRFTDELVSICGNTIIEPLPLSLKLVYWLNTIILLITSHAVFELYSGILND